MLRRIAENAVWLSRSHVRTAVLSRALTAHFDNLLDSPGKWQGHTTDNTAERWLPCLLLLDIDHADLFCEKTGEIKLTEQNDILSLLISDNRSSHSLSGLLQQTLVHLTCCQDSLHKDIVEHLSRTCQQYDEALSRNPDIHTCINMLPGLDSELLMLHGLIELRLPRTHFYHFLKIGEYLERAHQSVHLTQMAEDEWFRETPVLKLVTNNDVSSNKSDTRSAEAGENMLQPKRRNRSALCRQRVRELTRQVTGLNMGNNKKSERLLSGASSVDIDLFNALIQSQHQPHSLAFNLQGLCTEMSALDPRQQAVTIAKSLLRRVAFVDNPLQATDRETVLNLLDEYQYALDDIHQALFDRYMRGPEVPLFDANPALRASGNS